MLSVVVVFVVVAWMTDASSASVVYDVSHVTFAHAVNSRDRLIQELNGSVHFLEADVSMGLLQGTEFGVRIPIMAHPPYEVSDISLQDWLSLTRNTNKNIKLDFKSLEVVDPSLAILKQYVSQLNSSIWLNADILPGPILSPATPVNSGMFILSCLQNYPQAVLSLGWTTEWYPTFPPDQWHYGWNHVVLMAETIRCFRYEKRHPVFTFPVRGLFASRSIKQLRWLLRVVPGSTLTVWSSNYDPLELGDLLTIRRSFSWDKVYYDVPEGKVNDEFLAWKNTSTYRRPPTSNMFGIDQWITLSKDDRNPLSCSSNTYITENTLVFGKSAYSAALLKKPITVDSKTHLTVEGRIEFFDFEKTHEQTNQQLTIVIVDVSRFSKNASSTEELDLSTSDTDIVWSAVNSSQMYTFDRDDTNSCRMFRLDTREDNVFRTWKLYCDDMNGETSFVETVTRENVVEDTASYKRLVLPKSPFMIGFVSKGNSNVVVYDFIINDKMENTHASGSSLTTVSLGLLSILFMSFVVRGFLTEN